MDIQKIMEGIKKKKKEMKKKMEKKSKSQKGREINYQKLIEATGFHDDKLLIDVARELNYFKDRKSKILINYKKALNKVLYLDNQKKQVEREFSSDEYDVIGILNNNTGNDLIKWGFNKIHEYPTLSFREVKDQLTSNNIEADILTKFSISERQPIFLTLSGVFDYSNLKICELGEKEYWIEALYYILYGVAGAEYLQFLSNSIFEPTYTAPNEFQNDTKKIMVNCAPAQFATIVEILMNKDYLEKRSNGEGTARLLLKIFEFKSHNPSVESLGRKLFKRETQINETDYDDLNKIIHRKYLKGNKD